MVICGISGSEPEKPVISPQGIIFEKHLIEKHLEVNEKCPVTEEPLTTGELVELRTSAYTKLDPPKPNSLGNLISLFQNEWDAVMFENFSLQEQLSLARKELSENLYNHEAAARIIVRLNEKVAQLEKENEQLRTQMTVFGSTGDVPMMDAAQPEELGVTPVVTELFKTTSETLLNQRRGKKQFPDLLDKEQLKRFKCKHSNPIHATTSPGIKCVDVTGNKIVTGGNDGCVVLFNKQKNKVVAKMSGHHKPILDVELGATGTIASASADGTGRVWTSCDETNYTCASVTRCHTREVTAVSLHPANGHYITGSLDKSWALHDLNVGKVVSRMTTGEDEFSTVKIHPDGMFCATGGKNGLGSLKVYDILSQQPTSLPDQGGPVTSLNFSENGYYLIVSVQIGEGGQVKLWDLRKSSCLQTLEFEEIPNCARFDTTGKYLGVCFGNAISLHYFQSRSQLGDVVKLYGHEKPVQALSFLPNATSLVSVSLDRMVKIWEP